MTDVVAPRLPPALPSDEAMAVGTTVEAQEVQEVQALVGGALHLALWAFRPVVHRTMSYTGELLTESNPAWNGAVHRVRFRCSPWAKTVAVVLHYQRGKASGDSWVRLELRDAAGAVLDPGCEFTSSNGMLPRTDTGRGGARRWEVGLVERPPRVEATPVERTRPRLLNVPDAQRGTVLEVRISVEAARVVAAEVFEGA